jgi:hypothetical protein
MADEGRHTHAVVHFPADNSVEVVPIAWILSDGKSAYYPPTGFKKLRKATKDGEPPDQTWEIFECRVYKWFGKFSILVAKCPATPI